MGIGFVNLTVGNLAGGHLYCIIRSKKPHQGIEAKRRRLSNRPNKGHVFRKLDTEVTVFIGYAPLETAWVPITGDNYYCVYCSWALGSYKGKGYIKSLMEYCLTDAKAESKPGIYTLEAEKQESWLSDQSFARKFGFEVVDTTNNGYGLLALSFGGTIPRFTQNVKEQEIESNEPMIYYDTQCPYIRQDVEIIKQHCEMNGAPVSFTQADMSRRAKELSCVFGSWAVFCKGKLETVSLLLDANYLRKILRK